MSERITRDKLDLVKWASKPENMKKWIDWLNDPITRIILQGITDDYIPTKMTTPTSEEAIQTVGYMAGRSSVLFKLENLDIIVASLNGDGDNANEAGIFAYMKDHGYSEAEIRKHMKNEEGED